MRGATTPPAVAEINPDRLAHEIPMLSPFQVLLRLRTGGLLGLRAR